MALVRYALYIDALQRFSYLDGPRYLFLEANEVIIQESSDRAARNASSVTERLRLDHTVTVIGKSPLIGFKWLDAGTLRKFQIRLDSDYGYRSFLKAVSKQVEVLSPQQVEHGFDSSFNVTSSQDASRISSPRHNSCDDEHIAVPGEYWPRHSFPEASSLPSNDAPWTKTSTPVATASQHTSGTLKMPTPVSRIKVPLPEITANHHILNHAASGEPNELSDEELESRFVEFLQDDRNIALCKAVEKFWLKTGLTM